MATAPQPRLLTIPIKQQRQKLHTHGFILGTFSPRELCARGVWHFGTLPADLRRSSAISDAAKLMWSALAEMEATMPEVRPGLLRLAREIGKSRSTAIRAIEELEDNGLIQVMRQPRQKARPENSTNLYRFILNPRFFTESGAGSVTSSEIDTGSTGDTSVNSAPELVSILHRTSVKNGTQDKTISKTTAQESLEAATRQTASRIYGNHPHSRRDIGVGQISKLLRVILKHKKLIGAEATEYLNTLAVRHERFCGSEQWTKADGEYAKGLANWLAPTMERYDQEAPGGPPKSSSADSEPPGLRAGEIE